jgi:uncharacterized protein (TIGR02246 family)
MRSGKLQVKRKQLVTTVAILGIICSAPVSADDETKELFEQIGGKWIEHYLANDLDGLMTLYNDDARVMLHGKPAMQGKPAIREFFAAGMGTSEVTFDIDLEQAEVHGDMAYMISKYWMSIKPHGEERTFYDVGRSLLIYKKSDEGLWKIHADIDQATPDVSWPPPGS